MTKFAFLVAAVVITTAVQVQAQAKIVDQPASLAPTRDGFAGAVGLGGGTGDPSCNGCNFDTRTGFAGFLRLAGTLNANWILGGQLNGWTTDTENGRKMTVGAILATAQWYVYTPAGWYIEPGIGYGRARAEDDVLGETRSSGLTVFIGTGYDVRLARNFSFTPYVNLLSVLRNEAKVNGVRGNDELGANVVQFGMSFAWH